jgi:hypothetical protein
MNNRTTAAAPRNTLLLVAAAMTALSCQPEVAAPVDGGALDAGSADAGQARDAGPFTFEQDITKHQKVTMFALNTQEFIHVTEGRQTLRAVIALHEETGVPVDVYLTDTVVALLEDERTAGGVDSDLLDRVLTSPAVTLGYHTRAPKPYRTGYDWRGDLTSMATSDPARLQALVTDYENHVTDLSLGTPGSRLGGYAHLAELLGTPPLVVGASADGPVQNVVWQSFSDMGAVFFVAHAATGAGVNFKTRSNNLTLRPEHVDLRLIEVFEPGHAAGGCPQTWATDSAPEDLLDRALASACDASGSAPPCVVGVKMHDNDFFACDSAWATVYLAPGVFSNGPPFPLNRQAALLDAGEQARRWEFYQRIVRHAASLNETPAVSIADFARAL